MKTLFTGFSPNNTARDTRRALSFLVQPWKYFSGTHIKIVEEKFRTYFSVPFAVTCDSGRSALFLALEAFGVTKGDEVLVQAYTCMVVVNAIRKTGATPVYVDIDENFCTDPIDVAKKITAKTKVLLIQHTFGQAAQLDELIACAKENNIRTIEDGAHAFGTKYKGVLVGTVADIGILSFGSDKVLSCVRGGAAITSQKYLGEKLQELQQRLPNLPFHIVAQHLLHYPFFYFGRAWYGFGIGKILLALGKKLHLTNRIIDPIEKRGEFSHYAPATFPNALASLLLPQLTEVNEQNQHRREVSALYREGLQNVPGIILPNEDEESIYLRYTIRVVDPERIEKAAKAQGILLGDWYRTVIAPRDCIPGISGYTPGSCPRAEKFASQSLNLPTDRHITEADAQKIISFLHTCLAIPSAQ